MPLIVRDPGMRSSQRGKTDDNFVLNVDVAPTILGAAQVPAPAAMQGRDYSPLYRETAKLSPAWRDEFFYEHAIITSKERIPASEALVRRDSKYLLYPDYNYEELFDLKSDPLEQKNLIADPARKEQLAEMRTRFAELKARAR